MLNPKLCIHLSTVTEVQMGDGGVCEECIRQQGSWVHLRTCQTCGVTLCCDSSPGMHMTKHYHASRHPVVASAEPGERWLWCYPDEAFTEY